MSRRADYLIRESAAQADRIRSLELRAEDDAETIASLRREVFELECHLASAQRSHAIDDGASFGRAVAQLRQMFPAWEIEVTRTEKGKL